MENTRHPAGTYWLSFFEASERFCYYGMRSILTLYMVKFLFFDPMMESDPAIRSAITEHAGSIYGWFTGLVYLSPLIGGWLADKHLGQRKSVVIGAVLMGVGYCLMAIPSLPIFFIALGVVIMGNGFFKPNITTIVGQLYKKNDPRRDGGMTLFYMGINLGAFFSPFVCGTLAEHYGWHWGFLAAGVSMFLGLIIYAMGSHTLGDAGKYPVRKESAENRPLTHIEKQRIIVIFALTFFVIFFFVVFEQAGTSMTLFADRETDRMIGDWEVPASWFQSINPIFIMVLGLVFSRLWMWLDKFGKNPTIPMKMAIGLFFASGGSLIMAQAAKVAKNGELAGMEWLVFIYFIHTIGELCLSPIGLSMVTKLAPKKYLSMMMGVFFLGIAIASKIAGSFAGKYDTMAHDQFYVILAIAAGAAGLVLLPLAGPLHRMMHGAD